jgi:hypothetical protein
MEPALSMSIYIEPGVLNPAMLGASALSMSIYIEPGVLNPAMLGASALLERKGLA